MLEVVLSKIRAKVFRGFANFHFYFSGAGENHVVNGPKKKDHVETAVQCPPESRLQQTLSG